MVRAWKERGQEVPEAYRETLEEEGRDDEPELCWLEQQYLALFNVASTCRPAGMGGVLPLPFTAIAEVLDRHGWEGAEFHTAAHVLRAMDTEMLDYYSTKK